MGFTEEFSLKTTGTTLSMENLTDISFHQVTANTTWNNSQNTLVRNERQFLYYVFDVFGIIITLSIVIGNILVMVAVAKEKKLRKVGNIFIINLAVSDCLVGIVVSPLAISYGVTKNWVLGQAMCDFWVSMDVICCTASILNLCAIGYDRCNAIVQPMRYSRKRTFGRAMLIIGFVWSYAMLIALPRFWGWREEDEYLNNGECHVSHHLGYTLYSTIGSFYLPLIVMLYFYINIYRATCQRKHEWRRSPGCRHFVGHRVVHGKSPCCKCLTCWPFSIKKREYTDNETQTSNEEAGAASPDVGAQYTDKTEQLDYRRESIEPEILAIYKIRERNQRNLSTVTESSFSSVLFSSESSNTTSFSDSSGRSFSSGTYSSRSQSTSTEGSRSYSILSSGSRSMSTSTDSGRSYSILSSGSRRYSALRAHRLSSGRHSSLQTEVIHELAAAQAEQLANIAKLDEVDEMLTSDQPVICETDEANDDESDEPGARTKVKRTLKSSTFRRRNSRKRKRIAMSQERRAAKTLGIVMGCFVICWLPFFIITVLRGFYPKEHFHPILLQVVTWLGYFNSTCNPIIYTFFNKDFRKAFKKISCKSSSGIVYV